MYAKKNVSMKVVVLLLAVVLLIGCVAGGTLAYLMAKSSTVTNAFVVGDIGDLKLYENNVEITTATTNSFTIIPGKDITKDVAVSYSFTVKEGYDDVPVYVFVKVGATGWTVGTDNKTYTVSKDNQTLLSWSIADSWQFVTKETDGSMVYSCAVAADASLTNASVIAALTGEGNTGHIEVSSEITKANISEVSSTAGNITFTAYAIQQDGFADAAAAWAQAKTATN